MHAVVGHVSIDPARIQEPDQQLTEMVVPTVKGQKGFVSGIWTHSDAGKGVAITTFASKEDAQAFIVEMQSSPMPEDAPVTVESMELYRVAATA